MCYSGIIFAKKPIGSLILKNQSNKSSFKLSTAKEIDNAKTKNVIKLKPCPVGFFHAEENIDIDTIECPDGTTVPLIMLSTSYFEVSYCFLDFGEVTFVGLDDIEFFRGEC